MSVVQDPKPVCRTLSGLYLEPTCRQLSTYVGEESLIEMTISYLLYKECVTLIAPETWVWHTIAFSDVVVWSKPLLMTICTSAQPS